MAQGADTDGQPRDRISIRINLNKGARQHGLLPFSFNNRQDVNLQISNHIENHQLQYRTHGDTFLGSHSLNPHHRIQQRLLRSK